jgi:hypothetical protein
MLTRNENAKKMDRFLNLYALRHKHHNENTLMCDRKYHTTRFIPKSIHIFSSARYCALLLLSFTQEGDSPCLFRVFRDTHYCPPGHHPDWQRILNPNWNPN